MKVGSNNLSAYDGTDYTNLNLNLNSTNLNPILDNTGDTELLNLSTFDVTSHTDLRDKAKEVTRDRIGLGILLGVFLVMLGVMLMSSSQPSDFITESLAVSSFVALIVGVMFYYYELLGENDIYWLFFVFIIFAGSLIRLYNKNKDKEEQEQR